MDGAAAGGAGMMPELSPVPIEQWHGPWSDRQQAAGADARAATIARFAFDTCLSAVEMYVAPPGLPQTLHPITSPFLRPYPVTLAWVYVYARCDRRHQVLASIVAGCVG